MDLAQHSARQLVQLMSAGEISTADCVDFFLARIEQNKSLNAFVDIEANSQAELAELARRQASELDASYTAKQSTPLFGLPIAIKDGICTKSTLTTAGSKMLQSFRSPVDATCIHRLRDASAIPIGKTNMDEFAMGSSTENSYWGPTKNPFDHSRVPGGSSGGSAAAVAARLAPCALGSDTGGSIRQPAAFCGITGLKPTYGRVSRNGLIAFASSLDQVGPMARSAEDCALLMDVIAGHDPGDSTSSRVACEHYSDGINDSIDGLRIGVCRSFFGEGLDAEVGDAVEHALQQLKSMGATLVDVELPHSKYAVATYYVVAPCEASSNLSRYDGVRFSYRHTDESLDSMYAESRGHGFGAEVRRRIMLGTFALSSGYYDAYYLKASRMRRMIKQDFEDAFKSVDLIAGPTTPSTAFKIGERSADPLSMYLADVYTVAANLAGLPAISLPCGFDENRLPIGLQLQGPAFSESNLLRAAHQFQLNTSWHAEGPNNKPTGEAK
ncbi:MAG: Asp-tRNA(Asn)/Glu-tRNA(Gln) amidotransferase subunit GatA [Planctomycetota bacterium]